MTKSPEDIQKIQKIYTGIKSLRATAVLCACSPNTVKKYITEEIKYKKNIVLKVRNSSLLTGIYVGLWMGDGTQYFDKGYRIKICLDKRKPQLNHFVCHIIRELFGLDTHIVDEKTTNRSNIRFNSKFIYQYIRKYVTWKSNKTTSVQLGKRKHSKKFYKGFLLGVALSDGYVKERFILNVTSNVFAEDTFHILQLMNYQPTIRKVVRTNPKWKNIYSVSLTKAQTMILIRKLDSTIKAAGGNKTFREIKYEPAEI